MAEYIEREELVRQIICNMAEFIGAPDDVLKHDEQCNYAIFCVESAPAADVAPPVRCKDCRHSYEDIGGLTCSHGICVDCIVREDFFCADGVLRECDVGREG